MGKDQRNSYGFFRSSWEKNATWGGFAGIGNYLVDHQHSIHGSYFLYRNGEYLTTDPHNYGGQTAGELYNNLGIANPQDPGKGGPIFYYNQNPAFIERGRINSSSSQCDFMYTMLNASGSYNVPDTKYDNCNGCGKPVSYYTRHFYFDGVDNVFIIDKANLKYSASTNWRYRSQTKQAPNKISNNLISILSDKGTYRSLIKIIEPENIEWTYTNETDLFTQNKVENWQIDKTMWGYQMKAKDTSSTSHIWLSVINMDSVSNGNNQLNNSSKIISDTIIGLFAANSVFAVSKDQNLLLNNITYKTSSIVKSTRHIVGDITPGCYEVNSSIDGSLGKLTSNKDDNTLLFITNSEGIHTITISSSSSCSNSNANEKCAGSVSGNSVIVSTKAEILSISVIILIVFYLFYNLFNIFIIDKQTKIL